MTDTRQHPRTTQTEDLSATLQSVRRVCVVGSVLNLSRGGMLLASSGLEVDDTADFELTGPDLRFAGVAKVAHRSDQATGLRFLSWQGHADRSVCALIVSRRRGQLGSRDVGRRDPRVRRVVVFVGTERAQGADVNRGRDRHGARAEPGLARRRRSGKPDSALDRYWPKEVATWRILQVGSSYRPDSGRIADGLAVIRA